MNSRCSTMSRYRFIHAEQANYAVNLLCRVLAVARSAYYAWARRGVSARTTADKALTTQIAAAHARSRRTYGAPRIHAELRAQGVRCARKRVARLMRAAGLAGCHRRRRVRTTIAEPTHTPAPNLVAGTSSRRRPIISGSATSRMSPRRRAGCTSPCCWTSSPGASSAGPWPSICAPSWRAMRSRWRCKHAARARVSSTTPIAGANTPLKPTGQRWRRDSSPPR